MVEHLQLFERKERATIREKGGKKKGKKLSRVQPFGFLRGRGKTLARDEPFRGSHRREFILFPSNFDETADSRLPITDVLVLRTTLRGWIRSEGG